MKKRIADMPPGTVFKRLGRLWLRVFGYKSMIVSLTDFKIVTVYNNPKYEVVGYIEPNGKFTKAGDVLGYIDKDGKFTEASE